MALQMDKTFNGLVIPNAYIRIERLEIRTKTNMQAVVSINVNAQSTTPLFYQGYDTTYDLANVKNALKQAYEQLKALSDFSGAVDVLEAGQTI